MISTKRRLRAAIAVAGLIALTAACGGSDDDPPRQPEAEGEASESPGEGGGEAGALEGLTGREVLDRARDALVSVDSVRITMSGSPSGTMDLHLDRAGSCEGSIGILGTGSAEILVREGDEVWMKPDAEFWQNGSGVTDPTVVTLLDGSYLHGDTSEPELAGMAGTCSLDDLLAEAGDSAGNGEVVVGEATEHNGVPVIPLEVVDAGDGPSEIMVAAEGEPYPVLMTMEADGSQMELSQFNEPVEFEEPPAEYVLDLADFRSGEFQP